MVTAVAAARVATATAVSGKCVFAAGIVGSLAYVAASVTRFIGLEVIKASRTAFRERTVVAVARVEAIVHMAVEAVMAVEPGASTDEDSADEPIRAVVAVRRAVIRSIVEVSVWALWSDADVDSNLGGAPRRTNRESKGKHWNCKELTRDHIVSFVFV